MNSNSAWILSGIQGHTLGHCLVNARDKIQEWMIVLKENKRVRGNPRLTGSFFERHMLGKITSDAEYLGQDFLKIAC